MFQGFFALFEDIDFQGCRICVEPRMDNIMISDYAKASYEEYGKEFTGRGRNGKVFTSFA